MSQSPFDEYIKQAQEAGIGGVLGKGTYELEIKEARSGSTKAGKPQVSIQWRVHSGPYAGQTTWTNQTFSAESPKALAAFFTAMASLGIPKEFFSQLQSLDMSPVAARIQALSTGLVYNCGVDVWGTDGQNQSVYVKGTAQAGASAPAAPVPGGAAPVVVAQAPVAVPLPAFDPHTGLPTRPGV
jgi:hypothetical protein